MRGIYTGIAIALTTLACQKQGAGPPADCEAVGSYAAAFELGNYAPPEERAPTIARFVARCREVGVDQRQGACVLAAKDVWGAATCAPKLFPNVKVGGECDAIARKLGDALRSQMGQVADPKMLGMFAKVATAIRASCDSDGWTPALKACVLAAPDMLQGMDKCETHVTPELKSKLEARMKTAMGGN